MKGILRFFGITKTEALSGSEKQDMGGNLNTPAKINVQDQWCIIRVDYKKTLDEMVRAGGTCWRSSFFTSRAFPVVPTPEDKGRVRGVGCMLIKFERAVTTVEVDRYLASRNLKAGKVEHLLAFREQFPELAKMVTIAALGSVCNRSRFSRYIPLMVEYHGLNVISEGQMGWDDYFYFLAVGK